MEQRIEHTPYVQILDAPVPLMVEQLVDVLQLLDALIPVAEQVIDVPKMFIERIPAANLGSRAAAGRTAGGSTYDRVIFLVAADYGTDRGHSSSRRVVGESLVPKVFFRDRVQQLCRNAFLSGCWSR